MLSAQEVGSFRSGARFIGVDPGDVNTMTSAELGRRRSAADQGHREVIHSHLSLRNYERRTWRKHHMRWEKQRRLHNPAYGEAINTLGGAGTWATPVVAELDAMFAAQAVAWPALVEELVVDKEHAKWNMTAYRKRRSVLDQTARRMLNPTKVEVPDKKARALIVGYGNASFQTRGPRLKLRQAIVRAMRTLRAEGRPAIMVFVDEFRTSKLCHRCHGDMVTPKKKTARGNWTEDRRFRDCASCGEEEDRARALAGAEARRQ